ncbi:hypothetical protein P3L10_002896 [Capsicum annuum]
MQGAIRFAITLHLTAASDEDDRQSNNEVIRITIRENDDGLIAMFRSSELHYIQ